MAHEFTRLSDVETVEKPQDTANVLIEENGVIKKAPVSEVGGAGSGIESVVIDMNSKTIFYGNIELMFTGEGTVYYLSDAVVAKELITLLMDYTKHFKFTILETQDYLMHNVWEVRLNNSTYPSFRLGEVLFTVEEL